MSSVSPKKPGKQSVLKLNYPINHPQTTFKINRKFVITPAEKRAEYVRAHKPPKLRINTNLKAHATASQK